MAVMSYGNQGITSHSHHRSLVRYYSLEEGKGREGNRREAKRLKERRGREKEGKREETKGADREGKWKNENVIKDQNHREETEWHKEKENQIHSFKQR